MSGDVSPRDNIIWQFGLWYVSCVSPLKYQVSWAKRYTPFLSHSGGPPSEGTPHPHRKHSHSVMLVSNYKEFVILVMTSSWTAWFVLLDDSTIGLLWVFFTELFWGGHGRHSSLRRKTMVRRDWITKNINEGVEGRIHVLQLLAQDSVQRAIFPLWRNRHFLQPWMKGKTSFDTSMKIPCFILIHAWSELLLLSWKENNRSQSCQWSASLMMGTLIILSFTSHPWGMAWGSNFRMWFFTYFFFLI